MSLSHHTHHQVLFFFQKSLRNLFWSSFLRQSGLSLVDLFTVVYLYRAGTVNTFFLIGGLSDFQQGMLTVVGYILVLRVAALATIFPIAKLASRIGLPRIAILGNICMAIRYALLALSVYFPPMIFFSALLQGIEIAGFIPAYETMFARLASKTKVGRDVGSFTFVLKLTHALLPVLAGVLIVSAGFQAAFIGAMILLLLSTIPLMSMRWHRELTYPSPAHFFAWYRKEGDPLVWIAIAGRYLSDVATWLWPIYLVLLFGNIERLGLLMSASLFISLIVTYFSGWYVDHTKRNTVFLMGGALLCLFWIGRIGIVAVQLIIVLEIAQKIVESFFAPSFDAHVYRISKRLDTYAFHVYKEAMVTVIGLIYWSFLGILFLLYGAAWGWVFLFGAIGILATSLLYTSRYD
jgi:MFS family permease